MKIGVLTFHRAENFGAVLQCYALLTFLSINGYDVEVVDYRNDNIEKGYQLFKLNFFSLRAFCGSIKNNVLTFVARLLKKNKYRLFRKNHLRISSRIYKDESFCCNYDCLICGSDQIWNLRLTGGFDRVFFLDFQTDAKKIAYAASSEMRDYEKLKEYSLILKKSFQSFAAISVRERAFAEYLNSITGIDISTVLDPVFLISKDFYARIAKKPAETNYIFVYHLVNSPSASKYAEKISHETNKKVIELTAGFSQYHYKNHKILKNIGPQELLGFILYSDMVITTSFHGTALSLIFNKLFYVVDEGYNLRIKSLLSSVGLISQLLPNCEEKKVSEFFDYDEVNKKIANLVELSAEFLKRSLG